MKLWVLVLQVLCDDVICAFLPDGMGAMRASETAVLQKRKEMLHEWKCLLQKCKEERKKSVNFAT